MRLLATLLTATAASAALAVAAVSLTGHDRRVAHGALTRDLAAAASCRSRAAHARWPGACWRPYGARSPFNQRLPAHPRTVLASGRLVSELLAPGPPQLVDAVAGTSSDFGRPTFDALPTSPAYRIHCAVYACPGLERRRVRIPASARPAAGQDRHMTVLDQRGGWEYDFYGVLAKRDAARVVVAKTASRIRLRGPRADGLHARATAAGFGNLAGIVRAPELAAGRIDHALVVSIPCADGFVYPAAKGGARCASGALGAPLGARLALDMSDAEIAHSGFPRWKRAILRALARYGAFVVDTGGTEMHVALESDESYRSLGRPALMLELFMTLDARAWRAYRYLPLARGVDWTRLRVIDPCVTRRTC